MLLQFSYNKLKIVEKDGFNSHYAPKNSKEIVKKRRNRKKEKR